MEKITRIIFGLCLFFLGMISSPVSAQQITGAEYFFDTDPGFGNGVPISFMPDTNISLMNITIDYSAITFGNHVLYIRTRDNLGQWSLTNRASFYKKPFIVAAEYFIDSDPGFGLGNSIPINLPSADLNNLSSTINLIGLQSGVHTLFIRSKDTLGNWSLTNRTNFTYCTTGTSTFYSDADSDGYGNILQSIVACVMPIGYVADSSDCDDTDSLKHQQFTFYLDADGDGFGNPLQLVMQCVQSSNDAPSGYVINSSDCNDSNPFIYPGTIDKAEYFIDSDIGVGQGTSISISPSNADSLTFISGITIPMLSIGNHLIAIRTHTCNEQWSLFEQRSFHVTSFDIQTGPLLSAEFFIDTDPGVGNGIPVSISVADTIDQTVSLNIPITTPPGNHTIGIRVIDSLGQWGHFSNMLILVLPPPIPSYPIVAAEYFIDTDPGLGNAIALSISSTDTLLQTFGIPVPANLQEGHHLLAIRVKNSIGEWSLFDNRTFYIDDMGPVFNPIVQAEYFIDNDPGVGNGTSILLTQADTIDQNVTLAIPIALLTSSHLIAFRVKNLSGNWSHFELPSISIQIKTMLQGCYAGQGLMHPVLMNQGQVNLSNDVDTMWVDVRQPTSPYNIVSSKMAVLQTDGQLKVNIPNGLLGQSFYVALRHRNTVETWSANPIPLNLYNNPYDFSTAANQAFGSNMIEVDNGLWALYSGDIDQDDNVDLLDLSILENDITDFQFGYYATDINGDGNVDLLDAPIVEDNINGFVFSSHP